MKILIILGIIWGICAIFFIRAIIKAPVIDENTLLYQCGDGDNM